MIFEQAALLLRQQARLQVLCRGSPGAHSLWCGREACVSPPALGWRSEKASWRR